MFMQLVECSVLYIGHHLNNTAIACAQDAPSMLGEYSGIRMFHHHYSNPIQQAFQPSV